MNKYYALLISSVIFVLFHSLNFNLSLIAVINLFLAGILLGSTYIFTKNIWFPVSLHLFWNFFQGPILGYAVSGQKIASLYNIKLASNNYINGGEFGYEGSIICTIFALIAIVSILRYYYKKSNQSQTKIIVQTA
jgi:membrane protease YdiL (CAAX protease family)